MSGAQTRLDTLPALSLKVSGVTKAAKLEEAGVVTYQDLLQLPADKFKVLNSQLAGIDLGALRKRVRALCNPAKPDESQPTIDDLRRLPKRGVRKNYAEPADFRARDLSPSSESSASDSEDEVLSHPKKRKGAKQPVESKKRKTNGKHKEHETDTLVLVKRKEPAVPAPNWRNVARADAVRQDVLVARRQQIVDKELLKIEDHSVIDNMLTPLLPHMSKDCARIIAEYCVDSTAFRAVEILLNFARLQHLVSWGHPIATFDRESVFHLFHQARKRLTKKLVHEKEKTLGFDFAQFEEPTSHAIGTTIQTPILAVTPNARVTTTLYNYQLASLSWMVHLEQIVDQNGRWPLHIQLDEDNLAVEKNQIPRRRITPAKLDLSDSAYKWPGQNTTLCFDDVNWRMYPQDSVPPHRTLSWVTAVRLKIFAAKFRARVQRRLQRERSVNYAKTLGGVLADEMGLGKSLTCIALIASNQGKPRTILSHDPLPTSTSYPTRASIIVCPNHLVQQWEDQIKSHSTLKSICITTKLNHQKYSYADFLTTDAVLVSTHFLEGDYYHRLEAEALTSFSNPRRDLLAAAQSKFMAMQRGTANPLDMRAPLLSHFTWHRFILDEGHEVCVAKTSGRHNDQRSFSKLFDCVDRLDAKHRWYVSGTPFPSGDDSAIGLFRFLRAGLDGMEAGQTERPALLEQLKSAWFCRNTKQSIGNEHCVPGIYEQTEWLELSPVERGLYWWNSHFTTHEGLRQLACYAPLVDSDREVTQAGTLGHMYAAMVKKLRNTRTTNQEQLKRARTELAKLSPKNWEHRRTLETIERYLEGLQRCTTALAYFNSIGTLLGYPKVPESDDNDAPSSSPSPSSSSSFGSSSSSCSSGSSSSSSSSALTPPAPPPPPPPILKIPLKELMRSSAFLALQQCGQCTCVPSVIFVTPCGHALCEVCLDENLAIAQKCPTCSAPMERKQIAFLTPKQKPSAELEVIERHGTKLGSVVNKILQLVKVPHHRIIVFSQYDELLLKFAAILSENSIGNYFVRGNVHVRNKAIKEFQDALKPTVLLLSLTNAASGTDLAVATHVLLLDPIAGTEDEAKATESQAIGRAFRQGQKNRLIVIRFVVKNTVEQELHERKHVPRSKYGFSLETAYGHIVPDKFPI